MHNLVLHIHKKDEKRKIILHSVSYCVYNFKCANDSLEAEGVYKNIMATKEQYEIGKIKAREKKKKKTEHNS